MRDDVKELGLALRIEETKANLRDLEAQTADPAFWNNTENSSKVLQTIKQSQDKVQGYEQLCHRLEDAIALAEMAIEENDEGSVEEVQSELEAIKAEEEHKRIEVLLSGEYDKSNAIVSFHPGADDHGGRRERLRVSQERKRRAPPCAGFSVRRKRAAADFLCINRGHARI